MSITISQIKAGRALLGWTQEYLAYMAQMSKPALANIERGHVTPRKNTIQALRNAMETAGIEFTHGPGVRLAQDRLDVEVFRGADASFLLWDDIYQTLQSGGERLISYLDENQFLSRSEKELFEIFEKFEERGITGRILSLKGDTNFIDPTSEYRWVDADKFSDVTYYVYDDKYAIVIWDPAPRVVVIQNEIVAETYRKQFNRHWDMAERPNVV